MAYNENQVFERWFVQFKKIAKEDKKLKARKRFFRNDWRYYFLRNMTASEAIESYKKKEITDDGVLERFMKEFFPFSQFKQIGFFTKEMKGDYVAQAKRVCDFFGYETVYEYGAEEMRCHISWANWKERPDEPFVTVIPSIYD